ncbi:hypothetical protein F5X96DRAFT_694994 [Biscogniauxia mediterranea]|nr:hypothetical protein F5X96DRAFT_694994 [Biscogniauxia mediterranea]
METRMDVASWEFAQTLPPNSEYEPSEPDKVDYNHSGDFNEVQQPEFYAGITADGNVKAHVIAAVEFGISFDKRWDVGGDALASVVADGWVQARAHAAATTNGNYPFTWGLDVGVDLYAKAEAPPLFDWQLPKFPLPGSGMKPIIPMEKCPDPTLGVPEKRDHLTFCSSILEPRAMTISPNSQSGLLESRGLQSRARIPVDPLIRIPAQKLLCPETSSNGGGENSTACAKIKGWENNQLNNALRRRTLDDDNSSSSNPEHLHKWAVRSTDNGRTAKACLGALKNGVKFKAPPYETSGTLNTKVPAVKVYGYVDPDQCNDFSFDGNQEFPTTNTEDGWATEHILELQLISQFFDDANSKIGKVLPNYAPGKTDTQTLCQALNTLWVGVPDSQRFAMDGVKRDPVNHVLAVLPVNDNQYLDVLFDKGVNTAKERMFSGDATIQNDDTMTQYDSEGNRAVNNLKDVMTAMKYLQDSTIATRLKAQKERIATRLRDLDTGRWNTFISDKCATARTKATTHIDAHLGILKESYITDFMKEQAEKQAANGDTDLKNLIERIEKFDTEWTRYKPISWTNPF